MAKNISANDFNELVNSDPKIKQYIIDVRERAEVSENKNPYLASKNVPINDLMRNSKKYIKGDNTYYILSSKGIRSRIACFTLRRKNVKVINIKGGLKKLIK